MPNLFASLYYLYFKLITNTTALLIVGVIVIFITIAVLYYIYKLKPKLDKTYIGNKEFINKDTDDDMGSNNATLYFFYTTWCPHCKVAKPELDKLEKEIRGGLKDINVAVIRVDCDKDPELADQYKVSGYPTIKLIYNNKIYDYDAKPNKDTLMEFLNQTL